MRWKGSSPSVGRTRAAAILTWLAGALVVPVVPCHGTAAADLQIVVHLEVPGWSSEESLPQEVHVVLANGASGETIGRYGLDQVPGTVVARVPASSTGWVASADAPGWWSPTVPIAPVDRDVRLALVPEGRISFDVHGADSGVELLNGETVRIAGRLKRRGRRLPRGVYGGPCEVDLPRNRRDATIVCPFARDEVAEIRVLLGPFLPWSRPALAVRRDSDFGLFTPVRGARVSGSLAAPNGAGALRVALLPRDGGLAVTAWTDRDGQFDFAGVPTGQYDLRLAGAPRERWPVLVSSLLDWVDLGQLRSSATNRVSLEVLAPARIVDHLEVTAFSVRLDEDGKPTNVLGPPIKARRLSGNSARHEWWGLPTGHYEILVGDGRGNRWHRENLEFSASDSHVIDLDPVAVRGSVRRGSEPMEDVLAWFGGLLGGQRVALRSGRGGNFAGLLPREGPWLVEITQAPVCDPCEGEWESGRWEGFDRHDVSVAGVFDVAEGVDGFARVEIELADLRVGGQVVLAHPGTDESSPVPGAEVAIDMADREPPLHWSTSSSETGEFEVEGLSSGTASLVATARIDGRHYRSPRVNVRIPEDGQVDDLTLEISALRPLRLSLRSRGGAVNRGIAVLRYWEHGYESTLSGQSGLDGSIEFSLPSSSGVVSLVVFAEGFGSDGWRLQVPDDGLVEIELVEERGDLLVPGTADGTLKMRRGTVVAVSDLIRYGQVRRLEEGLLVRGLSPGSYTFCFEPGECRRIEVATGVLKRVTN